MTSTRQPTRTAQPLIMDQFLTNVVTRGRDGTFGGTRCSHHAAVAGANSGQLADAIGCCAGKDRGWRRSECRLDRSNVDVCGLPRRSRFRRRRTRHGAKDPENDEVIRPAALSLWAGAVGNRGPRLRRRSRCRAAADAIGLVSHTQPAGPARSKSAVLRSPGQFVS